MKILVDLRQTEIAELRYRFAFWDTEVSQFEIIGGNTAWDTLKDFKEDFSLEHKTEEELERYLKLAPDWTNQEIIQDEKV